MKITPINQPVNEYLFRVEYEGKQYNVKIWIDPEKSSKFSDWEVSDKNDENVLGPIEDAIIEQIDNDWDKLTA